MRKIIFCVKVEQVFLVWRNLTNIVPANKANGADGRFKVFIARFGFYWESVAAAHWRALAHILEKTGRYAETNNV